MTGGIIFAAPKSGSGKTLIVAGLLRLLRNRGSRAAAAKCGPDYIDPTFHTRASGRPCVNLDPWAMRPATLAAILSDLESSAELVLCEGVMGLFDGAGPGAASGSTAELARLTGWPVVLVVDAGGQGGSVAALIEGFARHDPRVPIAGVILNRVASPRHRALLGDAIAQYLPELPMLGAMPGTESLVLASRHLGLVPADEIADIDTLLGRAAARIEEACDIDRLAALATPARLMTAQGPSGLPPLGRHIAVARDAAFLFTYEATLAGWRRQGAALSFFSPLADEPPSLQADAIYLPGGYPELHAGRLAAASRFLAGLRDGSQTIYGECGGYMVLGEMLIDANGTTHRMAGLLPLKTSFAERCRHLGYRAVRLLGSGPLGDAGDGFRGHEFHYATIVEEKGEPLFAVGDTSGANLGRAGLRRGNVFGSFVHLIDRAD
ncbi:MAG TPA: cobyrinate a,c-diamide synthase [Stellaceae bacterium]|jgi:cobyrinic acid a,c-diamide synthase|nr:cobyrinate a,c-diamide synthase [Stellaceae bacterium]